MDELFKIHVNFVTRLRPNYKLFKDMVKEHRDICTSGNRMVYNGRIVYIERVEAQLTEKFRGYAYICVDSDRKHMEEKKLAVMYERGEITDSELDEYLLLAGSSWFPRT